MANNQTEKLFLGIKQVKDTTFNQLSDREKIGYLWFVSSGDSNSNYQIYLGSRKYGETNEDEKMREYIDDLVLKIRNSVGLDENFELPENFAQYSSITSGVYTKEEIDDMFSGAFRFKGSFEYLSQLFVSGETENGNVYQIVYRDVEEIDGELVPVEPPVLINSEFAYNGEEWVELGPLFDDRVIEDLEEQISGLTDSLSTEIENRISGETYLYNVIEEYNEITRQQIDTLFFGTTII